MPEFANASKCYLQLVRLDGNKVRAQYWSTLQQWYRNTTYFPHIHYVSCLLRSYASWSLLLYINDFQNETYFIYCLSCPVVLCQLTSLLKGEKRDVPNVKLITLLYYCYSNLSFLNLMKLSTHVQTFHNLNYTS